MRRVFQRKGATKREEGERDNENGKAGSGLRPVPPTSRDEDGGERTAASNAYFDVGVAGDCNRRYRKTMEDMSVVILDYMGVPGAGFFGVFDGHAGAQCARACAEHLHELLADEIASQTPPDVPQAMATSFETMDSRLVDMSIRHSGSTALVAVCCFVDARGAIVAPDAATGRRLFVANVGDSRAVLGAPVSATPAGDAAGGGGASSDAHSERTVPDSDEQSPGWEARRLSYDHRCSDVSEQRRVENAGGLVMNNRVNGMLAVTRSLGDLFMKSYVIGTPYTTDTVVGAADAELLVMACDGLWDVCSDDKAVEIAQRSLQEGHSALESSEALLDFALKAYSTDNLTTMVVKLRAPGRATKSTPPSSGASSGTSSAGAGSSQKPPEAAAVEAEAPPPAPPAAAAAAAAPKREADQN